VTDRRSFLLYAAGRLVSLVGTGIQDVAIPLFVLDLTGSAAIMGTFLIVSMVPRLALYPLAGVVGDKLNRKQIMIWTDFGRGAVLLVLAFLASRDLVTIPVLLLAQFLVSVMNGLFGPATGAMLADLVEPEELTRANSIMGGVNSTSMIIGPALGGVIYGLFGVTGAFLANGVSFLCSGFSEIFIRYTQETGALGGFKEVLGSMAEGLRFVRKSRGLMVLLVFALLVNFFMGPFFAIHLPYVMRIEIGFSAERFGLVQASFMGGLLLGNVLIASLFARSKVKNMLNRALLIESGLVFVLVAVIMPGSLEQLGYASLLTFGALVGIYLLFGLFNAFINTPIHVGIQRLAPTQYRARVLSVVEVSSQGIMPIGFGLMGIMLDLYPAYIIALGIAVVELAIVIPFVLRYSSAVAADLEARSPEETEVEG
jgi:MFS family permease